MGDFEGDRSFRRGGLSGRPALQLALVLLLGLLAYSNTFNAPLVLEDRANIAGNPAVRDLSYLTDPSKAASIADPGLRQRLRGGYLAYLSFHLDYSLFGADARWFHGVNLALHLLAAALVWRLTALLLKGRADGGEQSSGYAWAVPLLTGLLFAAHPVQTEAVSYISQRPVVLAAVFTLLSATLYAGSRRAEGIWRRRLLYLAALASAALAMRSRENALALPLLLAALEAVFFEGDRKRRAVVLLPFFALAFIVPAGALEFGQGAPSEPHPFSARLSAAATYIRLLLLPMNQNIDYDFPPHAGFLSAGPAMSLAVLAALLALAALSLIGQGRRSPQHRLLSFGIIWFLITLFADPASTAEPVVGEHRLYLPSFGAFAALSAGLVLLLDKPLKKTPAALAAVSMALLPLLLASACYARNSVWKSDVSLWEDAARKSPSKAGAHNSLGAAYLAAGLRDEALKEFWTAVNLAPEFLDAYRNVGLIYIERGLDKKAAEIFEYVLGVDPGSEEAHNSLGVLYGRAGKHALARDRFLMAVSLRPGYAEAHVNLAISYTALGQKGEAVRHYLAALAADPDNAAAHNNLGLLYQALGDPAAAERHFLDAVRLDGSFARAHNNLARLYFSQGLLDPAEEKALLAVSLDPALTDAHFNLGVIYMKQGLPQAAVSKFEKVLELRPDDEEAKEYLGRARRGGKP